MHGAYISRDMRIFIDKHYERFGWVFGAYRLSSRQDQSLYAEIMMMATYEYHKWRKPEYPQETSDIMRPLNIMSVCTWLSNNAFQQTS